MSKSAIALHTHRHTIIIIIIIIIIVHDLYSSMLSKDSNITAILKELYCHGLDAVPVA